MKKTALSSTSISPYDITEVKRNSKENSSYSNYSPVEFNPRKSSVIQFSFSSKSDSQNSRKK